MNEEPDNIKLRTARTLKWNTIDKVASQVLYAVTGIILANMVSKEEFGIVGSILIFQAFASLFVDSGFSSALIQKKSPTETDYCTVFYFNLAVSIAIYAILWFCAPAIAGLFKSERLIGLSRVMFLTFILNATAIVQTNRLMKQMTVKMIAVSNSIGLIVSGIIGIVLALSGFGAWAIVWQSVALAFTKSLILWTTSKWIPKLVFDLKALKSIFSVGMGVMSTSFLNVVSQNIYNYVIGVYYNLTSLGIYTQADKWSKMGITSLSQTLTSSFLPVLSGFQDDKERLNNAVSKCNRLTAYLMFPCFAVLIVSSQAVFHIFFGTKWDDAVPIFQLLLLRGMFTVLTMQYNNYILAVGKSKILVYSELAKDILLIAAIFFTIGFNLKVLVIGQIISSIAYFAIALGLTAKALGTNAFAMLKDIAPYIIITITAIIVPIMAVGCIKNSYLLFIFQTVSGFGIYLAICALLKSKIQKDVLGYALGRFINKR